jgi:hypothetical protein
MKKLFAILITVSLVFVCANYVSAHGCQGPKVELYVSAHGCQGPKVELGYLVTAGESHAWGTHPGAMSVWEINRLENCSLYMCQGNNNHMHLILECDEGPGGEEIPDGPGGEEIPRDPVFNLFGCESGECDTTTTIDHN